MSISKKYAIERKYINKGKARSGQKLVKGEPTFIVSHETANNTADADDHFAYFNNQQPNASAHTFIDSKKILEIIPLNEKAWHNLYGNPEDNHLFGEDANDTAAGVELCRTGSFKEGYDRYVWYHAYLCRTYGLDPLKKIVPHSRLDPRRRSDPESWLKPNGVTWAQFIKDVKNYYDNWHVKPDAAKTENKSVQILTGGLSAESCKIVSEYFIEKNWWGRLQFEEPGNPRMLSGGLSPSMRSEYEKWLKNLGWHYEIV